MECKKCGAENPGEAKFCEKCGSPLNAETPAESQKEEVSLETRGVEKSPDIVNSDEPVTKEMTSAFNENHKSSGEITADEKEKIRSEYFRYISKNPDVRNEIYDPKLVEIDNHGVVTDSNDINVVFRNSLLYWGIIAGAVLLIGVLLLIRSYVGQNIIGTILFIFALAVFGGMFIGVILNIVEFISNVRSSRDSKFKLMSAVQILPIIALLILSLVYFGIEGTIFIIIGFVVIGVIGVICMMSMSR